MHLVEIANIACTWDRDYRQHFVHIVSNLCESVLLQELVKGEIRAKLVTQGNARQEAKLITKGNARQEAKLVMCEPRLNILFGDM